MKMVLLPGTRWLSWLLAILLPTIVFATLLCFRTGTGLHGVQLVVATGIPEAESTRSMARVARTAVALGAHIEPIVTPGPADAIAALQTGRSQFAVVPIGAAPSLDGLQLVALLPVHLPFLLIGPAAGAVEHLRDLAGKRIATGPEGSATARLTASLLQQPELAPLGLQFVAGTPSEGIARLQRGEVDLLAMLGRTDSQVVRGAVAGSGDIASIAEVAALRDRTPFSREAVVPAATIDLYRNVPARPCHVLEFPLAVVCRPQIRRSAVIEMLRILQATYPALVAFHQQHIDDPILPQHDLAASYFTAGGPGFVDIHLPILHDLMPWSRLAPLVLAISLALNLLDLLRRYRLGVFVREYRRLGRAVAKLANLDALEVPLRAARQIPTASVTAAEFDRLLAEFVRLRSAARQQTESWSAPLEGDAAARAFELLSAEWEFALRKVRARVTGEAPLVAAVRDGGWSGRGDSGDAM